MNTVDRGNKFEERVYHIIEQAVEKGDIPVLKTACKFYKKKGYYSKDREKDIIFDISIEIYSHSNAPKYHLLYLIECKSYSKPIPVNDIEEFHSKINQVAGSNVKGIFITDAALQEGTMKFANSKGIMVIQTNYENNYDIILHQIKKNNEFNSKHTNSYELLSEIEYKMETFFSELFLPVDQKILGLNYYSRNDIEQFTEDIINDFDSNLLEKYKVINIEKFIQYIKERYNFLFIIKTSNYNISIIVFTD